MKAKYIAGLVAVAISSTVMAQTSRNSYFSDNIPTSNELNPAFAPEFDYVTVPGIGGITAGLNGNVGVGNFIYKRGYEMVTGLNEMISSDEFLGGLKSSNYMEANVGVNILSVGFKALGGFNTISINAKSSTSVSLPYDLFKFAKVGQDDGKATTYDINGTRVRTTEYAEIALGHSRQLSEKVRIGTKIKYLAGIGYADAKVSNIHVAMSQDSWTVYETGDLFTTPLLNFNYKENGEIDNIKFGEKVGVAGNGFAADLGVTYNPTKDLTLSASLTDIGFIHWKGDMNTLDPVPFYFDGFHHILSDEDEDGGASEISGEVDQLEEDLKALLHFQGESSAKRTQMLRTTLNLAGEYSILNDKIGFGLLSSTCFSTPKIWTELMASANFRPTRWFNATVNFSTSNLGHSLGALINFCPKGFNFYIGSDYIPFKYAKQGVPISTAKINLFLGMAITFNHSK